MAYTPTTWNDGDLITAEKLNKLEQGVQNEQVGPQGPKGDSGQDATINGQNAVKIVAGENINIDQSEPGKLTISTTGDGDGGTTYTAGEGIQINEQTIKVNISSASDNATGILDGQIYTPVSLLTKLYPLVVVTTNPATPSIEITANKGELTITETTDEKGQVILSLEAFGVWTISGTFNEKLAKVNLVIEEIKEYQITLIGEDIYGAIWDGTANSKWSRTDGAEFFEDPNPAVANGTGSSPFDNIAPWSDMEVVEDENAGTLVSIPKFYYKWTFSGDSMKLQLSTVKLDDTWHTSPAHADRGDGQGERDIIYIGRYHCGSDYKSTTGKLPVVNMPLSTARTNIHNLGEDIWQWDYAVNWTIKMLYLVEFADWNSQKVIGYGCSPKGTAFNVGLTDAMQYHTGTSAETRETYGCCQYRHIEGLWDNVYDWIDGFYGRSDGNAWYIANPSEFNDTSGGIQVIDRPNVSGNITSWMSSGVEGLDWILYPKTASGSDCSIYCCDYIQHGAKPVQFYVGGDYNEGEDNGLFYFDDRAGGSVGNYGGTRLIKLPNNT